MKVFAESVRKALVVEGGVQVSTLEPWWNGSEARDTWDRFSRGFQSGFRKEFWNYGV